MDELSSTARGSRERLLALISALAHNRPRRSVLTLSSEAWAAIKQALKNEAQQ